MIHQKATHECDKCGHTTDGKELFNELGEALGFEMDEEEPGDRDEGVPKPQGEGSRSALITPSSPLKDKKKNPRSQPIHPKQSNVRNVTTKEQPQKPFINTVGLNTRP